MKQVTTILKSAVLEPISNSVRTNVVAVGYTFDSSDGTGSKPIGVHIVMGMTIKLILRVGKSSMKTWVNIL